MKPLKPPKQATNQPGPDEGGEIRSNRRKVRTALMVTLIRFMPFIIVFVALIAAALLFLPIFGKPIISLVTTEEHSASELVLTEVTKICRFNTIEYHYKVVFPFDFDQPGISELSILEKIKKHFGSALETILTPEEKTWLEAVNLAKRNGLNPYTPDYHFLVATVNIKAGYLLDAAPPSLAIRTHTESGRTVRTAELTLPPPIITSIEVQDPERQNYPFPDLALAPQGWKEIAGFVRTHYISQGLRDGLLAKAQDNLQNYLRPLLIQAGYDEILFMTAGD